MEGGRERERGERRERYECPGRTKGEVRAREEMVFGVWNRPVP